MKSMHVVCSPNIKQDSENAVLQFAQRQANKHNEPYGVWEHVGDYGKPSGDIAARHTFKAQALSRPDPDDQWAMLAIVDPMESNHGEA